jgi:hypothetical protein
VRDREPLPRELEEEPPEALRPAELGVLELQRMAGNRAVSAMLSRQPTEEKAATATAGLGDDIGVIPIDSFSWGSGGGPGGSGGGAGKSETHELSIMFTLNAATPAIAQAAAQGTPIPAAFLSTQSMTIDLTDVLLTGYSQNDRGVSVTLNFASMKLRK